MYYIGSGYGNGMFTLREHNLIPTNYGVREEDRYVKILCRDYDKAVIKAKEFVGDRDKLEVGKAWDLEKWGEAEKPHRYVAPQLTPAEIAKREAEAKAEEIKKAKEEAEYQEVLRQRQEVYDKAEPVPVTEERIQFTGVIEKTYHKDNQWGGSYRLFFKDDRGFELNGGMGKSFEYVIFSQLKSKYYRDDEKYKKVQEEIEEEHSLLPEGAKVSFEAKVSPSDEDPKFGFFTRATKVKLLNPEILEKDADRHLYHAHEVVEIKF